MKTAMWFLCLSAAFTISCNQNSPKTDSARLAESLCQQECSGNAELTIDVDLRQCYCVEDDDLRHGKFLAWYENGQKKIEREYWLGELIGTSQTWYENGDPKGAFLWVDDDHHYVFFEEMFNGQPLLEGAYRDGLPYDNWIFYDPGTGYEKMNAYFISGVFCGTIRCSDPNGQPAPCSDEDSARLLRDGCTLTPSGADCPSCPDFNL